MMAPATTPKQSRRRTLPHRPKCDRSDYRHAASPGERPLGGHRRSWSGGPAPFQKGWLLLSAHCRRRYGMGAHGHSGPLTLTLGPWESCSHNPLLTHRSTGEPIQCVGHADLVEDPQGNTWLDCLGVRPIGYHAVHILGRESFLAPVCWKEGWPIAGSGGRFCLRQDLPALPPPHPWPQAATDPFTGPAFLNQAG
jgi:hypothetical protein